MSDYPIILSPFVDDDLEANAIYPELAHESEPGVLVYRPEIESIELWLDLNA